MLNWCGSGVFKVRCGWMRCKPNCAPPPGLGQYRGTQENRGKMGRRGGLKERGWFRGDSSAICSVIYPIPSVKSIQSLVLGLSMPKIEPYRMRISRLTVDKLGIKLYDRVAVVLAELVSNSYDGDAETVTIEAPMGQYLANKTAGKVISKDVCIKVTDQGMGMTPDELQDHYLIVGRDRRDQSKGGLGGTSPKYKRKVMGRKGIGKLAPFGVCRKIEIISSGGDIVSRSGKNGHETGYHTAHIIMDREEIVSDTDVDYEPELGSMDDTLQPDHGTTIILSDFIYRKVPDVETLSKQMAQRFGVSSANWQILLKNTVGEHDPADEPVKVGTLSIAVMENSRLEFEGPKDAVGTVQESDGGYVARAPDNTEYSDIKAGFHHEGSFYPVTGWVAYSKESYRDDLMAGIRIYCRGKIASQTPIFNLKAGFTGEHSIRSYLVGELNAEWLDDEDDLIHTDRRDILWSHELGQAFEEWGQRVVKIVGNITRDPMRQRTWDIFQKTGNLSAKIEDAFPIKNQEEIRGNAFKIARQLGKSIRPEEAETPEIVESLINLSLMLAPHITLDEMLLKASDEAETPMQAIGNIMQTARIAELASFGRIVEKRIDVIERLRGLKDAEQTDESALQDLIEGAPWLIDSRWAPITANQSLATLREELPKYFKKKGLEISLGHFEQGQKRKRPDFVLSGHDRKLQIVEIKRPNKKFDDEDMKRMLNYYHAFNDLFDDPQHSDLRGEYEDFHVTLVADGKRLSRNNDLLYDSVIKGGRLRHVSWMSFLATTAQHHKDFLAEAERQRRINYGQKDE